eukprot:387697-Hanusia_phi.AAC.1
MAACSTTRPRDDPMIYELVSPYPGRPGARRGPAVPLGGAGPAENFSALTRRGAAPAGGRPGPGGPSDRTGSGRARVGSYTGYR